MFRVERLQGLKGLNAGSTSVNGLIGFRLKA